MYAGGYNFRVTTRIPIETLQDRLARDWLSTNIGTPRVDWIADSDSRLLTVWFRCGRAAALFGRMKDG